MKVRNSMAHGSPDAKDRKEAEQQVLLTRVYETLFHRVLLKILRYDEYYIDYYLSGRKSRKINFPTGTEDNITISKMKKFAIAISNLIREYEPKGEKFSFGFVITSSNKK